MSDKGGDNATAAEATSPKKKMSGTIQQAVAAVEKEMKKKNSADWDKTAAAPDEPTPKYQEKKGEGEAQSKSAEDTDDKQPKPNPTEVAAKAIQDAAKAMEAVATSLAADQTKGGAGAEAETEEESKKRKGGPSDGLPATMKKKVKTKQTPAIPPPVYPYPYPYAPYPGYAPPPYAAPPYAAPPGTAPPYGAPGYGYHSYPYHPWSQSYANMYAQQTATSAATAAAATAPMPVLNKTPGGAAPAPALPIAAVPAPAAPKDPPAPVAEQNKAAPPTPSNKNKDKDKSKSTEAANQTTSEEETQTNTATETEGGEDNNSNKPKKRKGYVKKTPPPPPPPHPKWGKLGYIPLKPPTPPPAPAYAQRFPYPIHLRLEDGEDLPAFLQGLKVMYPKKSELTLKEIRKAEGKALQYDKATMDMHNNTIREIAEHLDYTLYTASRGNPNNAAKILSSLLRRTNLESVKKYMDARDSQSKENREQTSKERKLLIQSKTDALIVRGLKEFLHVHRTSCLRNPQHHIACEAVMTAACSVKNLTFRWDPEEEKENPDFPYDKFAKRLNKSVDDIKLFRDEMAGKMFEARKQKTIEDCYNDNPAGAAVLEFCHSEESSWLATNNESTRHAYRVVQNPITDQKEEHRLRVWFEGNKEERYRDFLLSEAYQKYLLRQRALGESGARIGFDVFCESTCPCVLDVHPRGKERRPPKKPVLTVMAQQHQHNNNNNNNNNNNATTHQNNYQHQEDLFDGSSLRGFDAARGLHNRW